MSRQSVTLWHMQHTVTGQRITATPEEFDLRRKQGYAPYCPQVEKREAGNGTAASYRRTA